MSDPSIPDPWHNVPMPFGEDGRHYAELLERFRGIQTLVASTHTPPEVSVEVGRRLDELTEVLEPWRVPEAGWPAGKRSDLPGRGHPLVPPWVLIDEQELSIRARVRLSEFYLGGNGAAHGGAVPLLFDDVMGRFANSNDRPRARTAYLHVNYRAITPIGPELSLDASITSDVGRKRYVSAELRAPAGELVADAEGLFVVLLPGQP